MRSSRRPWRPAPRGFTLVELLVVMGIIGLLFGLVLPAVQSAREAARRARCSNALKQLVTASDIFESSQGGFPPASGGILLTGPFGRKVNNASAHALLLPYLEERPLYDALNLELPMSSPADFANGNATAAAALIESFLCPSDPAARALGGGAPSPVSYRANIGLGNYRMDSEGVLWRDEVGAFKIGRILSLSEFTDGLSNTLAFSEKPIGDPTQRGGPGAWYPVGASGLTADHWRQACSNLDPATAVAESDAGRSWAIGGAIYTHFYASMPPNSPIPDCGTRQLGGERLFIARSYHPGGVMAAMCDGSVRWFSSGVDMATWRALGTRNRGDLPSAY